MANVITYGTYDLSHIGHLNLLQCARVSSGPDESFTAIALSDKFNWVQKWKCCAMPDYQCAKC